MHTALAPPHRSPADSSEGPDSFHIAECSHVVGHRTGHDQRKRLYQNAQAVRQRRDADRHTGAASTKLVAFAWLVERFEIGRRYTEAEVNRALGAANADFATLRRGLYDEDFVDRADGMYWRTPDAARLLIT
jgi:hypothetical protein